MFLPCLDSRMSQLTPKTLFYHHTRESDALTRSMSRPDKQAGTFQLIRTAFPEDPSGYDVK